MSDTGFCRDSMHSRKFFMCARMAGATCVSRSFSVLILGKLIELVGDVFVNGRAVPCPTGTKS